jgi:hypothetical protein
MMMMNCLRRNLNSLYLPESPFSFIIARYFLTEEVGLQDGRGASARVRVQSVILYL